MLNKFAGSVLKNFFRACIIFDIFALFRLIYRNKVTILFYHGVSLSPENELSNNDGKHVKASKFEGQMRYISQKYNPVSLSDAIAILKGRKKGVPNAVVITFDDGYYNNFEFAYPIIKKNNIPITIFLTTNYVDSPDKRRFLTWEEVKRMHQEGVAFGAHTVNHPYLTRISKNEIINEINDSKKDIELRLDNQIDSFSYPYGSFNENVKEAVRDSGYSCALTVNYGLNDSASDLFALKRIPINNNFTFEYFVSSLFPLFRGFISKIYTQKRIS